jgi:hypothetical protein
MLSIATFIAILSVVASTKGFIGQVLGDKHITEGIQMVVLLLKPGNTK